MIFVSYSRTDSDFVLKLATDLKDAGLDIWLDQLDIPVGAIWDNEIEMALQECDSIILVLSEHSINNNNVLSEVYFAMENNKRVLPVKMDGSKKIPFRLTRLHFVDLFVNYERGMKDLLRVFKSGQENPHHWTLNVVPEGVVPETVKVSDKIADVEKPFSNIATQEPDSNVPRSEPKHFDHTVPGKKAAASASPERSKATSAKKSAVNYQAKKTENAPQDNVDRVQTERQQAPDKQTPVNEFRATATPAAAQSKLKPGILVGALAIVVIAVVIILLVRPRHIEPNYEPATTTAVTDSAAVQPETPVSNVDPKTTTATTTTTPEQSQAVVADKSDIIRSFISAEDNGNIEEILSYFSPNVNRYWDLYNPTFNQLANAYQRAQSVSTDRRNTVDNIEMISDREYVLYTTFSYFSVKAQQQMSKPSRVKFVFDDNNKIVETYGL
jgi:hypothetical protein